MANQIARHLRKHETIAEKQLWKELRSLRVQGYHFRRQAPIDAFIVDFACFSHRLVIEVDGIQHDAGSGRKKDAARDAHLHWQGFTLLRFTNGEVAQDMEGVIAEVLASLGVLVKQE
jgi:very-short-patch-repair endonuclease